MAAALICTRRWRRTRRNRARASRPSCRASTAHSSSRRPRPPFTASLLPLPARTTGGATRSPSIISRRRGRRRQSDRRRSTWPRPASRTTRSSSGCAIYVQRGGSSRPISKASSVELWRAPPCVLACVLLYFANLILIRLQHVAVAIVYPVPSKSPKYTRSLYDCAGRKPFKTRKRVGETHVTNAAPIQRARSCPYAFSS